MKDRIKHCFHYCLDAFRLTVVYLVRLVERCFFWLPIKRKRILFYLHGRKGYACNLKYILEESIFLKSECFDLVWVTKWPEAVKTLEEKGVKVVKLYSLRHFYLQMTARVILISDAFPHLIRLRRGQKTINVWHGGLSYKHIGLRYCKFKNLFRRMAFSIANREPTYFLSGSEYFTKDTSASFDFSPTIFKPIGLPRNDLLACPPSTLKSTICKRYNIDQASKILLFAPTFREGMRNARCNVHFATLTASLSKRFGGQWVVLYRAHHFCASRVAQAIRQQVINVSAYEDMNELLAISDVLISDYSSCLWDFAITARPSFVYAPDLSDYRTHDRDFAYPLEAWPYPIATTEIGLYEAIEHFNEISFKANLAQHRKDCGSYDQGDATQKVVQLIVALTNNQPSHCASESNMDRT